MTPREYLDQYQHDSRIVRGGYFSACPVDVDAGDTVGVVLMNFGGPDAIENVQPFLYNLFMDPAVIEAPVGGVVRHWMAKLMARFRASSIEGDYEKIGGASPINRLTHEQADALERHLNRRVGREAGVTFRTYVAMRYWHPLSEEAAAQMEDDGVDCVVLLPLFPQHSGATTGSSMAYWHALQDAGEIPDWPTTAVYEYAANPKYVQAVSERIDEGLQRFPRRARSGAHLLFSAFGTPLREVADRRDPYCCLIHATVDRIMKHRGRDHTFDVAFQSKISPSQRQRPSTDEVVERLARRGTDAVLAVPVSFVSDHIQTSYELDIDIRRKAERRGIRHFEVTSGLNTHPLFVEALAEATVSQVNLTDDVSRHRVQGDGSPPEYPLRPVPERPRHASDTRHVRCKQCPGIAEPRCWKSDCVSDEEVAPTGDDTMRQKA
jgi:ferrochelatase